MTTSLSASGSVTAMSSATPKHAVDMLAIVRAVSVAHALAHIGVEKGRIVRVPLRALPNCP